MEKGIIRNLLVGFLFAFGFIGNNVSAAEAAEAAKANDGDAIHGPVVMPAVGEFGCERVHRLFCGICGTEIDVPAVDGMICSNAACGKALAKNGMCLVFNKHGLRAVGSPQVIIEILPIVDSSSVMIMDCRYDFIQERDRRQLAGPGRMNFGFVRPLIVAGVFTGVVYGMKAILFNKK
jgi:hypothetical protein